jgi:hypothetical protein
VIGGTTCRFSREHRLKVNLRFLILLGQDVPPLNSRTLTLPAISLQGLKTDPGVTNIRNIGSRTGDGGLVPSIAA